jgi:SNF2 family DNA or RNA helicase
VNLLRFEPLDKGRWALRSGFHEKFPEIAKTIPGVRWDKRKAAWIGYADAVILAARELEKARIVKAVGTWPTPRVPLSDREFSRDYSLREYQTVGTDFLLNIASEGGILADGMGLGKGRMCLAAIDEGLELPAIIVCPASVKKNWFIEGQKLGIDVHLLFGMSPADDAQIEESDGIVALNYELVDRWLPHLKNARTVIFDEGQVLANEKSKRSRACKALARKAKNRIVATGTPIQNWPRELFNIVDTVSPGRFGRWLDYMKRYAGAFQEEVPVRGGEEGETQKVWNTKGKSHQDELNERLKHFMLRRTKQDVQLELPAKTRDTREIDVSKEYKNPDRWWSLENTNQTQIALGLAAEGKVGAAVELAMTAIQNGSCVVLWVQRKTVAKILRKLLLQGGITPFMLTGDETPNRRQQNAEAAREQGSSVCIATIDSVGTGVNYLAFADIGIFVELHYVPGKLLQAEDRHHRQGAEKPVTIYYLIAIGTIDEMIRDVIIQKLQASEEILGTTGDTIRGDLRGMSDEECLDELRRTLMEDEGQT